MTDAEPRHTRVGVVIPAAGSGSRLGGATPKALRLLAGRPMLQWAAIALCDEPRIVSLAVAAPPGRVDEVSEMLAAALPARVQVRVVPGAASRAESVAAALHCLGEDIEVVLVHDAARPVVPADLTGRVIDAVLAGAAGAVPGLPVVDTIRQVDDRGHAVATPPRSRLRAVQTPQGFPAATLRQAYRRLADFDDPEGVTDDAALVEAMGERVVVVAGDPRTVKVTHPADVARVEEMMGHRTSGDEPSETTIGLGIDVHALDPRRPLHLAGLYWPDEVGLAGHSDADVACHAAADAVLSAAGLGDLGSNFGTAEPEWAGAAGSVLLSEAAARARAVGYAVGTISVQIIGNRPRIGPRRREAEQVMSAAAGGPVRLSATTTDGLGLTGRGEGVAALATALLRRTIPQETAE